MVYEWFILQYPASNAHSNCESMDVFQPTELWGKKLYFFLVIDLDRRLSIVTLKSFVPSFCARPPRLRLLRQSADGHELVDRPKGEHHHGHGHHHLGGGSFLGMVAPMSIRICMCLYLYMYVCLHVCMSV